MDAAIENNVKTVEELNEVHINGAKITDLINDKLASIGEKIGVSKFERIDAEFVSSYIHGSNRMGVLVGLNKENPEVGKDMAMQIAAMNPVAVDSSSVSAEVIEREKAIIFDLIKNDPKMAGKPDEMINKIGEGKLNAFFKESTLLAQAFVKDGGMSVGDYIKSKDSELKVVTFKRVALG
jgi:elongation factor Ts